MYILAGIVFIGIGIVMMIWPKVIFELTEAWKGYAGGEPSDLYIISTRFGGFMFFIVGAASMITQFIV